jgi:hypothetical protein
MKRQAAVRRLLYALLVVVVGVSAVWLTAGTFAPTTQGLILQTASHPATAATGNRDEAFVLVSAYNEAGPIRGILGGSFSVAVVASPDGADPVKKASVTEAVSGAYKIGLAPELSNHRWTGGRYVIAITLTSANGSGVALASLEIPR